MSGPDRQSPPGLRLDTALDALRLAAERRLAARRRSMLRAEDRPEPERQDVPVLHIQPEANPASEVPVRPFPPLERPDEQDAPRIDTLGIGGTKSTEAVPAEKTAFQRWAGLWLGRAR